MRAAQSNLALANATPYLHAFGHVVIAWLWLKQALVAVSASKAEIGHEKAMFLHGKLAACRYFFRYELPQVDAALQLTKSLDDTCFELEPDCL